MIAFLLTLPLHYKKEEKKIQKVCINIKVLNWIFETAVKTNFLNLVSEGQTKTNLILNLIWEKVLKTDLLDLIF